MTLRPSFLIGVGMVVLLAFAGVSSPRLVPQGPGQTVRLDQLDKAKFDALPPETVILLDRGRKTTKQELVTAAKQRLERRRTAEQLAARDAMVLQARLDRFLQEQRGRLAAANAKARVELTRLPRAGPVPAARHTEIQREAVQLRARYERASPAERAAIDRRAAVLLGELNRLGTRRPLPLRTPTPPEH